MGSGRASHAGYWFFIYVIVFPIYFISYGSWIIYMAPDVPSASMINSNIFAMMMLFCGILQPEHKMPGFWTFMYKLSPFTYVVQSLTTSVVHGKKVECIPWIENPWSTIRTNLWSILEHILQAPPRLLEEPRCHKQLWVLSIQQPRPSCCWVWCSLGPEMEKLWFPMGLHYFQLRCHVAVLLHNES